MKDIIVLDPEAVMIGDRNLIAREPHPVPGEGPVGAAPSLQLVSCGVLCDVFWWTGQRSSGRDSVN